MFRKQSMINCAISLKVTEKIKTAVPTAFILGSKPVTKEVHILIGRVISKLVRK